MEVVKEYTYNKNGKPVTIKRKYTIKGDRITKQNELDEYFKNHAEEIRNGKKLTDVVTDYNNTHELQVSYSMFYQKYKNCFGFRKNHNKAKVIEPEPSNTSESNSPETLQKPSKSSENSEEEEV